MSSVRFSPKYIGIAFFLIVSFHYIFSYSNETYSQKTSYANIKSTFTRPSSTSYRLEEESTDWETTAGNGTGKNVAGGRRANAAFVILARNSDVWEILASIRGMEG